MKKSFKLLSVIALTAIIAFAGLNCGGGGGGSSEPEITMKTQINGEFYLWIEGSGSITIDWEGTVTDMTLKVYDGFLPDSDFDYRHSNDGTPRTIRISGAENITLFDCSYNELTSLKLSGCTALTDLYCRINNLTSLNVSGCTALELLDCSENNLTSLNVSGCIALKSLDCYDNNLNKAALATLFNDIPIRPSNDGYIYIGGNPGAAEEPYFTYIDTTEVVKGWTVYDY